MRWPTVAHPRPPTGDGRRGPFKPALSNRVRSRQIRCQPPGSVAVAGGAGRARGPRFPCSRRTDNGFAGGSRDHIPGASQVGDALAVGLDRRGVPSVEAHAVAPLAQLVAAVPPHQVAGERFTVAGTGGSRDPRQGRPRRGAGRRPSVGGRRIGGETAERPASGVEDRSVRGRFLPDGACEHARRPRGGRPGRRVGPAASSGPAQVADAVVASRNHVKSR